MLPRAHIPEPLHELADGLHAQRSPPIGVPVDIDMWYAECPLCGLGEGGTEHLWDWCVAVQLAWL